LFWSRISKEQLLPARAANLGQQGVNAEAGGVKVCLPSRTTWRYSYATFDVPLGGVLWAPYVSRESMSDLGFFGK